MPELPPIPGEITMEELMELARRLSEHQENRPGTDKTWVLERMRKFQAIIRAPKTFTGIGPRAGDPLWPRPDSPKSDERS